MFKKGYKQTPEHKEKIRQKSLGRKVSDESKKKMRIAKLGKKISEEHKQNISKMLRGELSPYWKGGITIFNRLVRRSWKYRQWRSDVFERDDYTCQVCNSRGCYLEAHHLDGFSEIVKRNRLKDIDSAISCEELWNINNGLTLCSTCHKKTYKGRPQVNS